MKNNIKLLQLCIGILFFSILLTSCNEKSTPNLKDVKIAFIADVHFNDIYGKFQDSDFGITNPVNGKKALIRTMDAQLHSTRIFNENYFAFIAALDDVVKRNVDYVIFPGDFSDDGQAIHLRGLKRILDKYTKDYAIKFFIITGNHDPYKPFTFDSGKNDFLGEGGKAQPIMSKVGMYQPDLKKEHPVVITKDIQKLGYQDLTNILKDFGFFPKKEYLYWETPFSTYDYDSYNFESALAASKLDNRTYLVPPKDFSVPDVSYLIEPVEGLWLLAIDANVYIPKDDASTNAKDADNYSGSSSHGFNKFSSHKKHLISWIEKVVKEAKKQNKLLIPFSHFPMLEYNDGATKSINKVMYGDENSPTREPNDEVAELFANLGLKVHFGAHVHINDTSIKTTEKGNTLVNIQVPSLAYYLPSYKLLTIKGDEKLDIETITLDNVPRFKELFSMYKKEHQFLSSIDLKTIWDIEVLSSNSYHDFMRWHLKELTRLRFIPEDWQHETANFILKLNGKELFIFSKMDSSLSSQTILDKIKDNSIAFNKSWIKATKTVEKEAKANGFKLDDFKNWGGFDLIYDFYGLQNADKMAINDIGADKIKQYNMIKNLFLESQRQTSETDLIKENVSELFNILDAFLKGAPVKHFSLDLKTGELLNIEDQHTN